MTLVALQPAHRDHQVRVLSDLALGGNVEKIGPVGNDREEVARQIERRPEKIGLEAGDADEALGTGKERPECPPLQRSKPIAQRRRMAAAVKRQHIRKPSTLRRQHGEGRNERVAPLAVNDVHRRPAHRGVDPRCEVPVCPAWPSAHTTHRNTVNLLCRRQIAAAISRQHRHLVTGRDEPPGDLVCMHSSPAGMWNVLRAHVEDPEQLGRIETVSGAAPDQRSHVVDGDAGPERIHKRLTSRVRWINRKLMPAA